MSTLAALDGKHRPKLDYHKNPRKRLLDESVLNEGQCPCGRPAGEPLKRNTGLDGGVLTCQVLRLDPERHLCRTCRDISTVISDICRDKPRGKCEKMLKNTEYIRNATAAKTGFEVAEEARRVELEKAEAADRVNASTGLGDFVEGSLDDEETPTGALGEDDGDDDVSDDDDDDNGFIGLSASAFSIVY